MNQIICVAFLLQIGFAFDFNKYNALDKIEKYLATFNCNQGTVRSKVEIIGKTFEKRSIYMVKMFTKRKTRCRSCKGKSKKAILVDGGIHPRDFISHAFVLYFLNFLKTTQAGFYLVKKFDWYLIPVLNPDGYVYAKNFERLWRKNRSPFNETCIGTDLNRNYGKQWNPENGGSRNPCNELYSGPFPFSELESQAERKLMLKKAFIGYLSIQSFGQLWIYPWGFTKDPVPDKPTLDKCAKAAASAATARNGVVYSSRQTSERSTLGGLSSDYAKAAGIKFPYEVLLRDKGTFGHLLPEDQIIATCEETTDAVIAWANCVCAEMM
ncbi:carboxypeptidase B-like [Mytilus californianus]|uniref:carboxypeptidase B-like n=1 Tax=Mytilus californianus TaxID=6549 RepID=UPI002245E420|nr:carboxypeptidase B-like [Mytilus californianus]